jgi:hypothetical protein
MMTIAGIRPMREAGSMVGMPSMARPLTDRILCTTSQSLCRIVAVPCNASCYDSQLCRYSFEASEWTSFLTITRLPGWEILVSNVDRKTLTVFS